MAVEIQDAVLAVRVRDAGTGIAPQARSEGLGKGSEFVVYLPRRVLVVDDNEDAAGTVAELLEMLGNEVQVVHEGGPAVDRAAQFKPDVVLLDIGLHDINGYEVARRIRKLQGMRQPVRRAGCDGPVMGLRRACLCRRP